MRRYYEWQLIGPHDYLVIGGFDEQDLLLGFCFGGVFRGALSGFVSMNKKYLVSQVLIRPWLILTNPISRDRLRLGVLVSKNTTPQVSRDKKAATKNLEILSIAVDPHTQGQGIGRQLLDYSDSYALANGLSE